MNNYSRIGLSAVLAILLVLVLAFLGVISWNGGALGGFTAIAVATVISILRYRNSPD